MMTSSTNRDEVSLHTQTEAHEQLCKHKRRDRTLEIQQNTNKTKTSATVCKLMLQKKNASNEEEINEDELMGRETLK